MGKKAGLRKKEKEEDPSGTPRGALDTRGWGGWEQICDQQEEKVGKAGEVSVDKPKPSITPGIPKEGKGIP